MINRSASNRNSVTIEFLMFFLSLSLVLFVTVFAFNSAFFYNSGVVFPSAIKPVGNLIVYSLPFLSAFLALIIVYANGSRHRHRLLRRFGGVSASTGVAVLFFAVVIKYSRLVERINFENFSIDKSDFLNCFNDFVYYLIYEGSFFLIASLILIFLWYMSAIGKIKI